MADLGRLIAVGLSHHTAPVEVRERLAFDAAGVQGELDRLIKEEVCSEALLLSTCNRVEFYTVSLAEDRLRAYIATFRGAGGEPLEPYFYWLRGRDAVQHLFRVASALDSLVVGEPQILGQVKEAARAAEESHTLGRLLHPLVRHSLSVAKRIRTETALGRARVGIGNAGVDLAHHVYGDLAGRRALLVGVGEMGTQVARGLISAGLEELLVANRTYNKAVELATLHGYTPIPFDRIRDYLQRVDVVIAATAARTPILNRSDVATALRARRYDPLLLVDLSVPRNLDPQIAQLEEAYLFNIDDLAQVIAEGRKAREHAAERANELVVSETDRFITSLAEVGVGPRIGALTKAADELRMAEIDRSRKLLESLDDEQRERLDTLTRSLVKKLLHAPIQAIRGAARSGDHERVEALLDPWEKPE